MTKVLTALRDGNGRLVQTKKGTRYQRQKPTRQQLETTAYHHCIILSLDPSDYVTFGSKLKGWTNDQLCTFVTMNRVRAREFINQG